MKIQQIGTGAILTKYNSASAIIDEKILIDCPNGSVKSMRKLGINPKNIDVLAITHFHGDHYFDIPFLILEQVLNENRKDNFYIIGPKGLEKHIIELYNLGYPNTWEKNKIKSKLKIIELNEGKNVFSFGKYKFSMYEVLHENCEAFGYTISDGNKVAGFTGDTTLCKNVEVITELSNIAFVDMSFINSTKDHMGVTDILELLNKYGEKVQIIPTHMSDSARKYYQEKIGNPPNDGNLYEV